MQQQNLDLPQGYEEQQGGNLWLPQQIGETLMGVIIDEREDNEFGKKYLIETQDGMSYLTPCHKVLQDRMLHCKVGNQVCIKFIGEETPKVRSHKPTKLYKVGVKTQPQVTQQTVSDQQVNQDVAQQ